MFRQGKFLKNYTCGIRRYATGSGSSSGSGKRGHLLPLSILGAAAIGLTFYNATYTSKPPMAAIDPTASTNPLFPSSKYPDAINILFVLGGPGSGKGTQCGKLVKDFDFVHLSAGDLLRAERASGSESGELIENYIKEGLIVPQEITIKLLENAIVDAYNSGKRQFLIDGFPRKMDQALTFQNSVSSAKGVLYFDCPEAVMLKRLLKRGESSGRSDDNLESIKKRFRTFIETSMPVVDMFEEEGKVVNVSCDQPVDAVYDKVVADLKKRGVI
ncbi:bifunctional uridylate/adenylate kinase [Martiniozyma asiatica (nom. inval.)]|nr:bifunctional uridylate/adenylate kinase [Martiniozyma asiatica]